jgi:hypothetical protein
MANVCIDPSSAKYEWWQKWVSPAGFPDATGPAGTAVSPPSNEALALSRVGTAQTVEGGGGFLALTGREFTNYAFTPKGVGPREGGHKIVVLPGETNGLCTADGRLAGDEYCRDEYRLYRWLATSSVPQGVLIQAHPGDAKEMDLRPLHPRNAPGGFSDAFVQGVEVSSSKNDPQWEASYQRMLRSGYRVFPAFGSDSHDATSAQQASTARAARRSAGSPIERAARSSRQCRRAAATTRRRCGPRCASRCVPSTRARGCRWADCSTPRTGASRSACSR